MLNYLLRSLNIALHFVIPLRCTGFGADQQMLMKIRETHQRSSEPATASTLAIPFHIGLAFVMWVMLNGYRKNLAGLF